MKILKLLLILTTLVSCSGITLVSCSGIEESEQIKSPYNKDNIKYKKLKYYRKENQKEQTTIHAISSIANYYKVYTLKDTNIPIKEEFYKNNRLTWYKGFFYGKNNKLKSVNYYNTANNKIKELVYGENINVVFRTEYTYDKDSNLVKKRRYNLNNKAEGWWIKYNKNGNAVKRTFYTNGKLREYFVYLYDKNNKLIKETRHTK